MPSTALEQKCLDLWLLSPATPYCNLWLWLVITIFFTSKPLPVTFCFIINGWFSRVGHWTCINAYFHKHIHDLLITLLLKTDNDGTNILGHTLKWSKGKIERFLLRSVESSCILFTFCRNTRRQGAKKVCFIACHSGNLQLAFTSPRVISTSLQKIVEHWLQFFCNLNFTKNFIVHWAS